MDNFKQAVTELTGLEETAGENKSPEQPEAPYMSVRRASELTESKSFEQFPAQPQPPAPEKKPAEKEDEDFNFFVGDSVVKTPEVARVQPVSRFSQALDLAASKAPATGATGTIIAAGTVIDGNVSSNGDLMICGVVNGDVLNANKLVIHGEVAGSISAKDISLVDSIIAGNVEAQNSTEMTKDSCILGDLTTQNVVVSGRVKGNIEAKGNGIFKKDSVVLGNISVGTIIIEGGAKMRGFISTTDGDQEVDEELFPKK
jgi:cytoskeletal protein CcmA (bactofilin family)